MKTILHFSHANGFPGGSYSALLAALSNDYDVRWTDRIAHHPDYPVNNNWLNLEQEMIANFERSYSEPIIAVGHS
ncbi:MAG TPA: alpha/beta hydrolase, partial [Pseudomonadales bacterium]|nr:alpha/beta hydrolase [Pseudomonadales bacterium]